MNVRFSKQKRSSGQAGGNADDGRIKMKEILDEIYQTTKRIKSGEILELSVEGAQLHAVFSEYKEK